MLSLDIVRLHCYVAAEKFHQWGFSLRTRCDGVKKRFLFITQVDMSEGHVVIIVCG
jgi:hypothetical protein